MAVLDAYATLDAYKARNNLTATTNDDAIEDLLVDRSRQAERLLHVAPGYWNSHTATYTFDGSGDRMLWLRDRRGQGYCLTAITADSCAIDSDLDGTADFSLDLADDWLRGLPENAAGQGEPFTSLELVPSTSATISTWPSLPGCVSITGTWGWASVPFVISEFVIKLVRDVLDNQSAGLSRQLFDINGNQVDVAEDTFAHFMSVSSSFGRRNWSF